MDAKIPAQNWISPKIEILKSPIQGIGMFAKEPIKKSELVLIWGGYGYTDKAGAEKKKAEGKLTMQWDDDLFSFETRGEESAYYINHSCEPNVWMRDAFRLETMRDIKKGEELTVDHAMFKSEVDYISKWKCNCGTQKCRKQITGTDYKLRELQKAYADHFSPLINKKIAGLKK